MENNRIHTQVESTKVTLAEYRCNCGKLLFKAFLLLGQVEIKCKRCGRVNLLDFAKTTAEAE